DLRSGAVEDGDGEAFALHVEDKVLAHHGEADEADVCGSAAHGGVSQVKMVPWFAEILLRDRTSVMLYCGEMVASSFVSRFWLSNPAAMTCLPWDKTATLFRERSVFKP